mmetsp:Transcript_4960/g.5483  ORF Transcript_4960/g.5483 Transcript_4960/m.5483 type:complete len:252 (-) Transcript_4960:558-1313(-)
MPGDLNLKKSWHPGLMKNQKKLWEQEQEALSEHLKIKAKNEELKREKEKQELIKLQYGDAKDIPIEVKRELNNLNWMYNDSKPSSKSDSEFNDMDDEFLLGKRKVENMLSGNKYIDTQETSRFEETVSSANNGHKNIDNDPLLKIKNEQLKKYQAAKDSNRHSSKDRYSSKDRHRSRDRSPKKHSSKHRNDCNKISKLSHLNHKDSKSKRSKLKSSHHHSREKDSNITESKDYKNASQRDNSKTSSQFIAY